MPAIWWCSGCASWASVCPGVLVPADPARRPLPPPPGRARTRGAAPPLGRHDRAGADREAEETVRLWPVFRAGLLVDLLNPKTVIFFLALLPQFVPGGALTASAAAVMVVCVVGLGLLFDGGYAALAGGLQRRRGLTAVGRWGPPLAGGCFLALAAVTFLG